MFNIFLSNAKVRYEMDELLMRADTARRHAASRLVGTDNYVSTLLFQASIIQNASTRKPTALSLPFSEDIGRGFSFDLDPNWIDLTSIDDIAAKFTDIVYDAISHGLLPSEAVP
jgi:hypothetical protein